MPRESDIPQCPGRPVRRTQVERSFHIELITPMFGGGVEPRLNDTTFPIRPTAIRGHLQFWWRATVGARCQSVDDLRAAQTAVWGSTEQASPIAVEVRSVIASEPVPCVVYRWDKNARRGDGRFKADWTHVVSLSGKQVSRTLPVYALFPFQGKPPRGGHDAQPEQTPDSCTHHCTFDVHLSYPKQMEPEIEAAVRAWVNFGGVGSRTRRGCGALYCAEFAPSPKDRLSQWFQHMSTTAESRKWPTLTCAPLVSDEAEDPLMVWEKLMGKYRHFRQGEGFGRNTGPGRSYYPEPETIRRLTGRRMPKHSAQKMPDGFPRAELGLPIVFHFKDENRGEPADTTLVPRVDGVVRERMSSPLIIKPLAIGSELAVPLVMCLGAQRPDQVELLDKNQRPLIREFQVPVRSNAFAKVKSPLSELMATGSSLEAFLAYVQSSENNFKSIAS